MQHAGSAGEEGNGPLILVLAGPYMYRTDRTQHA